MKLSSANCKYKFTLYVAVILRAGNILWRSFSYILNFRTHFQVSVILQKVEITWSAEKVSFWLDVDFVHHAWPKPQIATAGLVRVLSNLKIINKSEKVFPGMILCYLNFGDRGWWYLWKGSVSNEKLSVWSRTWGIASELHDVDWAVRSVENIVSFAIGIRGQKPKLYF